MARGLEFGHRWFIVKRDQFSILAVLSCLNIALPILPLCAHWADILTINMSHKHIVMQLFFPLAWW